MPTVQVRSMNALNEDEVIGTISLGPVGIQLDPPDSPVLKNMLRPFRSRINGSMVDPRNGHTFLQELEDKYTNVYLRVVPIPDTPAVQPQTPPKKSSRNDSAASGPGEGNSPG